MSPKWYLYVAGRRASERRLIHILYLGVNPYELVELRTAACDIQNSDLGPFRVSFHVKIIGGCNSLAVHDNHVLSADGG